MGIERQVVKRLQRTLPIGVNGRVPPNRIIPQEPAPPGKRLDRTSKPPVWALHANEINHKRTTSATASDRAGARPRGERAGGSRSGAPPPAFISMGGSDSFDSFDLDNPIDNPAMLGALGFLCGVLVLFLMRGRQAMRQARVHTFTVWHTHTHTQHLARSTASATTRTHTPTHATHPQREPEPGPTPRAHRAAPPGRASAPSLRTSLR